MTNAEARRNARAALVEQEDDCGTAFKSRKALVGHIRAYKGELTTFGRVLKAAAK